MSFIQKLNAAWASSQSLLMVGLDPDLPRLPAELQGKPTAIFEFCRQIVDATAPFVCGFKPQIAYFAAARAEADRETENKGEAHERHCGGRARALANACEAALCDERWCAIER